MAIVPQTAKWKMLKKKPEVSLNVIEEKIIAIPTILENKWRVSAGFSAGWIFFSTWRFTVG